MRDVVVLSAVRTAIGDYGGALKELPPSELAAKIVAEAVKRANIDSNEINHGVFGNVIHGEARDMYLARVACINGGLPQHTAAFSVNRLCGSGLQAIISASQYILLGDTDAAIAGGAESMSRGGYLLPALRWGQRMNNSSVIDMMVGALTDPFETVHMGITAENIAEKWNISREEQDIYSLESHRRAVNAIQCGTFKDQILPIEIKNRKNITLFDTDEHPRENIDIAALSKLNAVFQKNGTVTAGNASGINDGAAFFVLAAADAAAKAGQKPIARLVSYAVAGVPNEIMGEGPIPASRLALKKAGLTLAQMDVIESNEAFAAQALSVAKVLELDMDKTNPNGGAIALGHPVGCSGAFIATKALYELQRSGGKYALVTMCIGGGQGIATIFERV